jgi:hypothetical protein
VAVSTTRKARAEAAEAAVTAGSSGSSSSRRQPAAGGEEVHKGLEHRLVALERLDRPGQPRDDDLAAVARGEERGPGRLVAEGVEHPGPGRDGGRVQDLVDPPLQLVLLEELLEGAARVR